MARHPRALYARRRSCRFASSNGHTGAKSSNLHGGPDPDKWRNRAPPRSLHDRKSLTLACSPQSFRPGPDEKLMPLQLDYRTVHERLTK